MRIFFHSSANFRFVIASDCGSGMSESFLIFRDSRPSRNRMAHSFTVVYERLASPSTTFKSMRISFGSLPRRHFFSDVYSSRLNYVHRDIKPDNILIDKTGHIKLADFGSCLKLDENGEAHSNIAVGTPDYISPEILRAMEDGKGTYGKECDWWSLGICLFEMLFGEVPFYAESLVDTYSKIVDHNYTYPVNVDENEVSSDARDLISHLICPANTRLGKSNCSEIQQHTFFDNIDWTKLNSSKPPYIPEFIDDSDTSNFEEISEPVIPKIISPPANFKHVPGQLPFVGYSYMRMSSNAIISDIPLDPNSKRKRMSSPGIDPEIQSNFDDRDVSPEIIRDNLLKTAKSGTICSNFDSGLANNLAFSDADVNGFSPDHVKDKQISNLQCQSLSHNSQGLIKTDSCPKVCYNHNQGDVSFENDLLVDPPSSDELRNLYISDANMQNTVLSNEYNSLCSKYHGVKSLYISLKEVYQETQNKVAKYNNFYGCDDSEIGSDNFNKPVLFENVDNPSDSCSRIPSRTQKDISSKEINLHNNTLYNISKKIQVEQDARKYLRHFADDLSSEIEKIKNINLSNSIKHEAWHERRSVKNDSQRLHELQLALDSEINAKQQISDELARTKEQQALNETQIHSLTKQAQELYNLIQKKQNQLHKRDLEIQELRKNLVGISSPSDQNSYSSDSLVAYLAANAGENFSNKNKRIFSDKSDIFCDKFESLSSSSTISGSPPNSPSRITKSGPQPTRNIPPTQHHFSITTLYEPIICDHCCSFMLGLIRQCVRCETCNYQCHLHCADLKDTSACPSSQKARKLVFNAATGIGTIYQGLVKVPKPNGVRKGWLKQLMIICDYKILFYDISIDKSHTYRLVQFIDICDEDFYISKVVDSEVIHAHPKLVPQIFKLSSCLRGCKDINPSILVLMQNESIRDTILTILSELRLFVKQNKLTKSPLYRPRELYDSTQLDLLRYINSACLIDTERLLIGCEDGLYLLDIFNHFCNRISDKKVYQLEFVESEGLVIYSAGRQKVLQMIPILSLESTDYSPVKIIDTKGSNIFATGFVQQSTFIAVAIRKRLILFEVTKPSISKYTKIKEITMQSTIMSLNIFGSRICLGINSGFIIVFIQGDASPLYLVNNEDSTLAFLSISPFEPLCSIELNLGKEYLLCFDLLAIYVDHFGRRTRQYEIKWLASPSSIVYHPPFLLAYCETSIDVYDPNSGAWLQTIPLKRTESISKEGTILVSYQSDPPKLVYLQNCSQTSNPTLQLKFTDVPTLHHKNNFQKSRGSKGALDVWRSKSDKRHIEISPPTDFSHVQHVGSKDFFVLHPLPADADDPPNASIFVDNNPLNSISDLNTSSDNTSVFQVYSNQWDSSIAPYNQQFSSKSNLQPPTLAPCENVSTIPNKFGITNTSATIQDELPIMNDEGLKHQLLTKNKHIL
ncbi:Serine/threonine-protein kinase MRCK alpha-like [Oopsacas minuta]|uniref:non-specific serine/threonine protein kinase n=1 Tax=Oopsacas minuta TaxID=111878 RepID=A0AAV7JQF2_9METZ|nr:Serine/threonine-protein kinase MRCK alpha-like [Oopsacas minuta]